MTEIMTCPVCEAENPVAFAYCEECGSPLPEQSVEPSQVIEEFDGEFEGDDEVPYELEAIPAEDVESPDDEDLPSDAYEEDAFEEDAYEEDAFEEEAAFENEAYELEAVEASEFEPESEAEFEPEPEPEFESEPEPAIVAQRSTSRPVVHVEPLPEPGGFEVAPTFTLFRDREALHNFPIDADVLVLGGGDDAQIDLSSFSSTPLASKHVAIYRQNKNLTVYALSDRPTQLNDELLRLGEKRTLTNGDILILAEEIALRLEEQQGDAAID